MELMQILNMYITYVKIQNSMTASEPELYGEINMFYQFHVA